LPTPADDERPGLRAVWNDPYLKRLLLLAVVGPIVTMGIDFVFKSIVSAEVPKASLGSFFALYNAIVNAAALAVQLTLAPWLLQRLGVVRILCVLPAALGAVATGMAGTVTLPAALVLRGMDGTLRHSLHRAATEILFLPLPPSARIALRGFAESIGLRGGQVVGSVAILVAIAVGASPRELAVGIAVLCGVWLLGYARLREHYVDRFRTQLRALGATTDAAVPDLDLHSIEALVASLGSPNDAEVLAALDLLDAYGRVRLVSPLILYHPSPAVVLRALDLFDGIERGDLQELRRRLLAHADETVRVASLRRVAMGGQDRALIRATLRHDVSPLVRRTALVLWMAGQDAPETDVREAVGDLVALEDPKARLAIASALGELPARVVEPVARALLDGASPDLRRQVARSLANGPDTDRVGLLIELLAIPECRAFARAGLQAVGPAALEHLARALEDVATPPAVRRHLPQTISRFDSGRAADILVAQLAGEPDGRVVHKILRGLGRLRADHPDLPIDRATLVKLAERTLERMIGLLAYRVAHELVRAETVSTPPDPLDLLGRLLEEMEQRALERIFRVLQILETSEEFKAIFQALHADAPALHAGGREVISHVLDGHFRDALLALTDSLPAAERLQAAAGALPVPLADMALHAWRARTKAGSPDAEDPRPLAAVIEALCADRSVTLASVAWRELHAWRPSDGWEVPTRVAS
jgi:AAA family ATP:ADP antiporter